MEIGPTALIETEFADAQLIGVPLVLRACVARRVLEVWFERSDGAAQCERYVRELLRREADLQTWPAYVLTTQPADSIEDGKITLDGSNLYRITDAALLDDAITKGWNSELQPFVVFVDGPEALRLTEPPQSHPLCGARFAVACGADGCVAQLVPLRGSVATLGITTGE